MEKHFELTDGEFEKQFEQGTLDAAIFTHEAHLRLAWIHIGQYGIDHALNNVTTQLLAFVNSLGVTDKYNTTVTISAVRAVYHFMLSSETNDFRSFITENPRLKTNFRDLISQHYKTDIFKSAQAKNKYLEPELLPFD